MRRLLSKEKVDEGLDFKELATMTEGYSGSDLKVCGFETKFIESIQHLTIVLDNRTLFLHFTESRRHHPASDYRMLDN